MEREIQEQPALAAAVPAHTTRRAFSYAFAGWFVPFLIVLPLFGRHETAGGEAALFAGAVWLFFLGPIGSVVAGWFGGRFDSRTAALGGGLAAVAGSVVPIFAIDAWISVLTVGVAAFALIVPLALGYLVGFGLGVATRAIRRRRDPRGRHP